MQVTGKTRILYAHQDGLLTGSAISLADLLKTIDRTRFQPSVLLARDGPAREYFQPLAYRVEVIPAHGFWTAPSAACYQLSYYRNFKAFLPNRALRGFLEKSKPDLVHVNDKSMIAVGLAASRLGVPVVWHLRSAYSGGRSWLLPAISRTVIRRVARHAIAISEDEVEGLEGRIPLEVIYNSVDLREADDAVALRDQTRANLGLSNGELAICMVGRLTATKGAWDFIEAAGIAQQRRPDLRLRFVIAADIPGRDSLHWGWRGRLGLMDTTHPEDRVWQLARQAGVEKRLVLTGFRRDILMVLAAMDVITACYRLRAVGRPALEGMAVGIPVVVNPGHTNRQGIVKHLVNGLVAPSARPERLAEAIIQLAGDPDLRRRLGSAGRDYARRNFDPRQNCRRIERIYERVLGAQR